MNELMERRGEPALFMRVCHNPTLTDEQIRGVFSYLVKAKRKKWAQECAHQTFLLYMDSDGQWRDNRGYLFSSKVNFWQYADVPECDISC